MRERALRGKSPEERYRYILACMEELQIPIFAKAYDLYKLLGSWRGGIPKQDRHALWQRAEERMLAIIEGLLRASQQPSGQKVAILETVSVDLNVLRVFLRLAKDTRAIDLKKYTQAQIQRDEIGRVLGGWLRSLRSGSKPPPPVEHPDEKRGRKCQRDATP